MSTPLVLDGAALAKASEAELAVRVEAVVAATWWKPILATVLVGDDPGSATYVRMKGNACRRVGMESLRIALGAETTTEELLGQLDALNANPNVHGILLQHPVPAQIDERACFDRIAAEKDVDGVTALGFGLMTMGERAFGSATPAGIIVRRPASQPQTLSHLASTRSPIRTRVVRTSSRPRLTLPTQRRTSSRSHVRSLTSRLGSRTASRSLSGPTRRSTSSRATRAGSSRSGVSRASRSSSRGTGRSGRSGRSGGRSSGRSGGRR